MSQFTADKRPLWRNTLRRRNSVTANAMSCCTCNSCACKRPVCPATETSEVSAANHLDELPDGTFRFRKRFPLVHRETIGRVYFQKRLKGTEGADLAAQHAQCMSEYEKLVQAALETSQSPNKPLLAPTPLQTFTHSVRASHSVLEGIQGLDLDDPSDREIIAESVEDPDVREVILRPNSPTPQPNLRDALEMYLRERVKDDERLAIRVRSVFAEVRDAIGDVDLPDLKREHARAVRDHLLAVPKYGGGVRSASTVKRMLNSVRAVVSYGLVEFDMADQNNPFVKLPITGLTEKRSVDLRLPLTDALVEGVERRLSGDLGRIWLVLANTGCRVAEVAGLTLNDVVLTGDIPHILVRPNDVRVLKTQSSIRSVPLLGDALEALKEAVVGISGPVFRRYARDRGADAVSAALMKHLRSLSKDKRMTVHSLRHRVSDTRKKTMARP